MANSISKTVTKGKIEFVRFLENEHQKPGTITAEIKQVHTTTSTYPSKRVDSNLQDSAFSNSDFGFESKVYNSEETLMAWIPVPVGIKPEEVQAKLDEQQAQGACIYKALSCAPIIDNNQAYAIQQGFKTLADFANKQAVRFPENEETIANKTANTLILDKNSNVQYRRTFYSRTAKDTQDVRDQEAPYLSPELKAELQGASVMNGQTV